MQYMFDKEKIGIEEKFIQDFGNSLYNEKIKNSYMDIIFLCIGTDKIIGDCFGPIVGSNLIQLFEKYNIYNINIYGSLNEIVNYCNIKKIVEEIYIKYKNPFIVVIDAALSKKENIGKIFVTTEKTILGKGLNKNKIEVGNISIKAVVAKDYKVANYNFKTLQNVPLNNVMKLSNIVSNGIYEVIKYT